MALNLYQVKVHDMQEPRYGEDPRYEVRMVAESCTSAIEAVLHQVVEAADVPKGRLELDEACILAQNISIPLTLLESLLEGDNE